MVGVVALTGAAACGDDGESATQNGGGGSEEESVSLRRLNVMLDWRWSGQHVPLMAALCNDAFADEGLNVVLMQPAGVGDSNKFVAAGSADIGLAFTTDHVIAAENVPGVVAIASFLRHNSHGVGVLAGNEISSAEDLRGKTVALSAAPVSQKMFDAFLADAGMTRDDIGELVTTGFNLEQLLAEGRTDANVGVDYGLVARLAAMDQEVEFIYFRDHGAPDYPFGVVISGEDFLAENGDTARAFLRGLWEGVELATADPRAAVECAAEEDPAIDVDALLSQWQLVEPLLTDEMTEAEGLGAHDFDMIQDLADFLHEHELVGTPLEASALATSDYLE